VSDFALPDGIVGSEHLGVRVFCVAAPDPQQLGDQIALVLGEHLDPDDELHTSPTAHSKPAGSTTPAGPDGLAASRTPNCSWGTPRSSSCEPQPPTKTGDKRQPRARDRAIGGSGEPPDSVALRD
jgi:hypothetical protein